MQAFRENEIQRQNTKFLLSQQKCDNFLAELEKRSLRERNRTAVYHALTMQGIGLSAMKDTINGIHVGVAKNLEKEMEILRNNLKSVELRIQQDYQ